MKRVINEASHATVAETVAHLIAEVEARGMKLFTTIDHSADARANGLQLRETKPVVFGNPRTGTPIVQAAPLAGLDLPLKVLVRAEPGPITPGVGSSSRSVGAIAQGSVVDAEKVESCG